MKTIESQREKKAIEEHGKQLAEFNTLIKEYAYHNEKTAQHFWGKKVVTELIAGTR